MGMYQEIGNVWKQPRKTLGLLYRNRLTLWRQEEVITSIERPTRLDRARALGYKPKKGVVLVRVRVTRGGRKRESRKHGRRSRTQRRRKIVGMSYQWIAEQKAQRKHKNLEVLNSYPVGEDGVYAWYEVILIDPDRPEIRADPQYSWIALPQHTYRVFRGKTSAGRKSRGLRKKGEGAEKLRPSRRAHDRLAK